ncbi:hypothetical protein [Streptomyces sp. NPDC006309]
MGLAGGTVDERFVDDLAVKVPTINEDRLGGEHRHRHVRPHDRMTA